VSQGGQYHCRSTASIRIDADGKPAGAFYPLTCVTRVRRAAARGHSSGTGAPSVVVQAFHLRQGLRWTRRSLGRGGQACRFLPSSRVRSAVPDEWSRAVARERRVEKRVLRPRLSMDASIRLVPQPALSTITAGADSQASGRQSGSTRMGSLRARFTL
jgi:hypothetical protein